MSGFERPRVMPDDAGAGLATRRLVLRRFTAADLPFHRRIDLDPVGMRFMGGVRTAEQTAAFLAERVVGYYTEHPRLGIWAVCLRTAEGRAGECIGMANLNHIQGELLLQIGYRLAPEHWGAGYATEISFALLLYGFARLELQLITAFTNPGHAVSQRVLTKVGLERVADRSFDHPVLAKHNPFAFFERCRAAWLAEFAPEYLMGAACR